MSDNLVDFFAHLETKGPLPVKPGKAPVGARPVFQATDAAAGKPNQLVNAEDVARYLMAPTSGAAKVTFVSLKTGARFTFKVSRLKEDGKAKLGGPLFVSVLTGPDNTRDYSYLGTIFESSSYNAPSARGEYRHGRKSRIGADAPSAKAFAWVAANVLGRGILPPQVEIFHSGNCGRCGRALTDPASIMRGLGPECFGRI